MNGISEITAPDDIEGVDNAVVKEILVADSDEVKAGDVLITIETEKAIIEVASPCNGAVSEVFVGVGDVVTVETLLLKIRADGAETTVKDKISPSEDYRDLVTQVVVLGSGPGGYSAAFRAADLGKEVVLIERQDSLGGVCLNVGCIPSKSLLHAAKVISEAREMSGMGLNFSSFHLDNDVLCAWKNKVIHQLASGLTTLAKKRNIKIVKGTGTFASSHCLKVDVVEGRSLTVEFEWAVIAAGSEPIRIPGFPYDDPRVLTSTEALEIHNVSGRILIVGGGIIGLEMAMVYHEMGAKVTVVEFADSLIPGGDVDLVKPLHQRIAGLYENIYLSSKVTRMESTLNGIFVTFDGDVPQKKDVFDQVLVAVGRAPNGKLIDAGKAGVHVDERGFISTDDRMRTNVDHIFAVGDVVGPPMLAHKAAHEGKVAAEVIAGMESRFDGNLIPSVAYTDPEVAWVGVTENQARELNIKYEKGTFPWAASGRALSLGRKEGLTKTLYDAKTKKIIGAGIVGSHAGDLISEAALAIKVGCTASEMGALIHPHPTLSETVGLSAEVVEKTIVDMYVK